MGLSLSSVVYSFSWAYLKKGAAIFSSSRYSLRLSSRLVATTHTCSAQRPILLHTFTQTHTQTQIQASHCCHGDYFNPVSTSKICPERGNLPLFPCFAVFLSTHPPLLLLLLLLLFFFFFSHSKMEKKSHPPFSRGMTIASPILSVRFIHPQCLAPAISSPPTLTPTLYSLYEAVCIHLLLPQAE